MQKPIPMCYKEAFADTDVDKSGRLDTRELFNMLRSVSDKGLMFWAGRLSHYLKLRRNECLFRLWKNYIKCAPSHVITTMWDLSFSQESLLNGLNSKTTLLVFQFQRPRVRSYFGSHITCAFFKLKQGFKNHEVTLVESCSIRKRFSL